MKAQAIHEMTNEELTNKLSSLKAELYQLRFNHATGQLTNSSLLPLCKKDIARVMTVLKEREIKGITGPVADVKKPAKAPKAKKEVK